MFVKEEIDYLARSKKSTAQMWTDVNKGEQVII